MSEGVLMLFFFGFIAVFVVGMWLLIVGWHPPHSLWQWERDNERDRLK